MSAAAPRRVALVTGGNKGIGYAIVQSLAAQTEPSLTVLLGSRDKQRGLDAVQRLRHELAQSAGSVEMDVRPLTIDVADEASVRQAADEVKRQYGGLDILINNAGIASKGDAFDDTIASNTLRTNYYGQHTSSAHRSCMHTDMLISRTPMDIAAALALS